ncbi:MAG: DUF2784 domain-containing protein [Spirochaetaceae bacterium]|nr:MAG: DUF2784 domain-containing protein [Spirochaetaceae bacterium]
MGRLYGIAADAVVIFHFCYVTFTVGGEVLILLGCLFRWRWVRNLTFRIIHLVAMAVVALEALIGVLCPLTDWEYRLRLLAGQDIEEEIPFMARLVRQIIFYDFPAWVFTVTYILFTLLVVATLLFVPPRRKAKPDN